MVDHLEYKFFSLKEFDRFFVETKTNITKYAFRHGSKIGGTSNGVRTFTLTFTAFASDEKARFELIKLVSNIFNPPAVMSDTDGFHDLEFTTPDGNVRTCKAQTTRRPRMFDYNNSKRVSFEVQLVAQNGSMIFGKNKNVIKDTNTRMGKRTKAKFPIKAQYFRDNIAYNGVATSPVSVIITAKKDLNLPWLYIRSYNGKTLNTTMEFGNTQLREGEQIFIKSLEETVYKYSNNTKTNITNEITINSQRPYINTQFGGNSRLVVDCGMIEPVLDVEYCYQNIRD